jgi:hypothetical protein
MYVARLHTGPDEFPARALEQFPITSPTETAERIIAS